MKYGIHPPASGRYKNQFSESCGCFIRSEIWACLAPGRPQIAVKYAYEDACVDHSDEGIYAELFCAAIQSAAFAESDRDTLIDIGLSYSIAIQLQTINCEYVGLSEMRTTSVFSKNS